MVEKCKCITDAKEVAEVLGIDCVFKSTHTHTISVKPQMKLRIQCFNVDRAIVNMNERLQQLKSHHARVQNFYDLKLEI